MNWDAKCIFLQFVKAVSASGTTATLCPGQNGAKFSMYSFLLQADHAWHSDVHEPLAKQSYIGDPTLEDVLEWPWGGQYSNQPHTLFLISMSQQLVVQVLRYHLSFKRKEFS